MKSKYLISNKFKIPGWLLLGPGLLAGLLEITMEFDTDILSISVLSLYNGDSLFSNNNGFFLILTNGVLDEIIALCIIIGGLLVGFSEEKIEDEFIYKLRKDSLVWAIIFNYIVLMFAIIFIYEFTFFNILVFNMFTPLLFFIIRFNILKARA